MSKPNASSGRSSRGRFITGLAASIVGAAALALAAPLPASADEGGRWAERIEKGKQDKNGRQQGKGHGKAKDQDRGQRGGWNGGNDRGGSHGGWSGGGNKNDWNKSNWNGNDRTNYGGHGGGGYDRDDDRHHGGSNHYHYYEPPKVKHHHHYYSQPVYVPQPVYIAPPAYAYGPSYWCDPCSHFFASYDDLYAHAAHAHYVPDYDLPNLVVQVGVNWVFGF